MPSANGCADLTPLTPAEFRTARKALGYTQKQLAEALRMGKHGWQTISKWEADDFTGTIPGPVQIALEHIAHCRGEYRSKSDG